MWFVAIVTDAPLFGLFNGEKEKTSHNNNTSPEVERRLKDIKDEESEGLVQRVTEKIISPCVAATCQNLLFLFCFQESREFETFTPTQNKKSQSKGLCAHACFFIYS